MRDAIFGKLGLPLRDLGQKALKNIDRPVHIYQIQSPGARARRDWLGGWACARNIAAWRPAPAGLSMLFAATARGFGAWRFWPRETVRTEYTPVMAVLPFTNASGDASLDSLGPSLAREVSSMLATYPMFRMVVALGPAAEREASALAGRYALDGRPLEERGQAAR